VRLRNGQGPWGILEKLRRKKKKSGYYYVDKKGKKSGKVVQNTQAKEGKYGTTRFLEGNKVVLRGYSRWRITLEEIDSHLS